MNPDKLRATADKMSATIAEKLHPAIGDQNWTDRRQRIADRMRKDGQDLQSIQYMLYGIADAIESDRLPPVLIGLKISTKALMETILYNSSYPDPEYRQSDVARLKKAGITANIYDDVRKSLMSLSRPPDHSEEDERRRVYNESRRLVGIIPGFFPTPAGVAEEIVGMADIDNTMTILEPSCGSGSILLAISDKIGTLKNVTAVEINYTLAQQTENIHDIEVDRCDFMEWDGGKFDRVIMNPPFEKFQDVDHVIKAFSHLNDGGTLVSIMSPSWTFSKTRKAEDFRMFVNEHGYKIDLEQGSFKESGTGVNSVVVVLEK